MHTQYNLDLMPILYQSNFGIIFNLRYSGGTLVLLSTFYCQVDEYP